MAVLSCVFWGASHAKTSFTTDSPNCISAQLVQGRFAVGFVSQRGDSSFFVTTSKYDSSESSWSERRDGHFCGFPVPPSGIAVEPKGLNVHASSQGLSWTCPYWLMTTIWSISLLRLRRSLQFNLREFLIVMLCLAAAFSLVELRIALPMAIFLNLATAWLLVRGAYAAVRGNVTLRQPSPNCTEVVDKDHV
ncbi:hypothetical protein PLANPX_6141 [Lacipirellula parvula]|uniref:Uncharacterized protein n=2 Tax=Lacipirellula parvula TaxID=2650471 RepID=A0A5K7XRG3_9BACT|nr:hypothetical protein PLANPX_6141 [Lacipirellula parvula]